MIETDPDSYQAKVILPNIIRILDPKPGMTVLDIACGQGYFARAFHGAGARVIGSDISRELIEIARKNSPAEISFHDAPADKLTFAADASVDAAVIILAIQNIEKMSETFAEAMRVLKSDSRLILVINHPTFRIPGRSSWGWDEKAGEAGAGTQYRRIDGYMSDIQNKVDMNPGESDVAAKKFTFSFHRPLQSYFKALNKAGFAVTRLEEWISHKKSQKGPRSAEEDRIRKEIPMFLMLEARKM